MYGRWLAGLGLIALPLTGWAQDLTLDIDPDKAQQFGIELDALEQELESQAGEALNLVDPESFVQSMANASGIAAKGMGVDYASNMDAFVIGGSFGSSVHSSGFRFTRSDDPLPPGGFAFMISVMAGVNLGVLDGGTDTFLDRIRIYGNGMSINIPNDREFGGAMYNVGVHGQIKLIPESGTKLVEWGGIDFTGGWEQAQYRLELEKPVDITAPVDGPEVTWTADGTYTITSVTDAVPLELSSNFRVAVVTVFLGAGVDFNTSSSTSEAALAGPVDASFQGRSESIGTAALSVAFDGVGDPVVPRAFGGLQLNLSLLKVYGHLNAGLNGTVGGHLGARVAL